MTKRIERQNYKKWWKSKLLWTGVSMILGAGITSLATTPDWKAAGLAAAGASVIWLRMVTKDGLK